MPLAVERTGIEQPRMLSSRLASGIGPTGRDAGVMPDRQGSADGR